MMKSTHLSAVYLQKAGMEPIWVINEKPTVAIDGYWPPTMIRGRIAGGPAGLSHIYMIGLYPSLAISA